MDSGALDALVTCLEEFDPSVKEAAAWVGRSRSADGTFFGVLQFWKMFGVLGTGFCGKWEVQRSVSFVEMVGRRVVNYN